MNKFLRWCVSFYQFLVVERVGYRRPSLVTHADRLDRLEMDARALRLLQAIQYLDLKIDLAALKATVHTVVNPKR